MSALVCCFLRTNLSHISDSLTKEEIEEARDFFPSMTREQLIELIETTDYFHGLILDELTGLIESTEHQYS